MESLGDCNFSYSDGQKWVNSWDDKKELTPRAIKVSFKYKEENKQKEFEVNIPVSP